MTSFRCTVHDWQLVQPLPQSDLKDQQEPSDPWQCALCTSTAAACVECGDPVETTLTVCKPCVDRGRKVIDDIEEMRASGLKQDPYSPIHSTRYDRDQVTTSEDESRLPFGLDAVVSDPDDVRVTTLRTVPDALKVLDDWARRWAEVRHVAPPASTHGFLREHVLWALQNRDLSQWPVFFRQVRQVRAVVRRLLGLLPEREPVPCVHCGGRIVHHWTDHGLDELARCTGCDMEWQHGGHLRHTNYLVLRALPETHPNLLVTLEDANRIYTGMMAKSQVYMWFSRGQLEQRGESRGGLPTFRLGDIEEMLKGQRSAS